MTAVANELVVAHPGGAPAAAWPRPAGRRPGPVPARERGFKLRVLGAYWGKRVLATIAVAAVLAAGATLPALLLWSLVLVVLVVLAAAEATELPDGVGEAAPQPIDGHANTRLGGADRSRS